MSKAATVQARIDSQLKQKAEVILKHLGLTASQTINALYAQIVLQKGVPFELKIPNSTTLAAIKELEEGKGQTFDTFEDMMSDINTVD